jgi:hypothetical protein
MMTHVYDTDTSLSESYSSIHSEFLPRFASGWFSFLFLRFLLLSWWWHVVESVALLIFPPVVAVADNCMNKCSDDRTYNVSRMYSVQHVSLSPPELGQSEVFGRRVVSVFGRAALSFPSNEFGQVLLFFLTRDSISLGWWWRCDIATRVYGLWTLLAEHIGKEGRKYRRRVEGSMMGFIRVSDVERLLVVHVFDSRAPLYTTYCYRCYIISACERGIWPYLRKVHDIMSIWPNLWSY